MSKTLWVITAVATAAVSIGMNYLLKSDKGDNLAETAPTKIDEDTQHMGKPLESDKETLEIFL